MKTGWIEKFQAGLVKATLKSEFKLLEPGEAKKLLAQEAYRQTTADHLPRLSENSSLYRAITKDIFQGHLVLLSQSQLSKGDRLEAILHLPQYAIPLRLLAEAGRVETTTEMGRNLFHAELVVLAIHKTDVESLAQSLIQNQSV
jgi:hypothetical protein